MAIQYGTCGSWKAVRRLLAVDLPNCSSPDHLLAAIDRLQSERSQWANHAAIEVHQQIEALRCRLPVLEADARSSGERLSHPIRSELTALESEIRQLATARFLPARWFNRIFRVPALTQRSKILRQQLARIVSASGQSLLKAREELEKLERDPERAIASRVASRLAKLQRLQAARESSEYAGAVAECEMALLLSQGLPDAFHVFHDVAIEVDHWIFDGKEHRRSAQLDHVVVGLGGVFVIETKLWSNDFAAKGRYQDPFKQIKWAAKLCHIVLSDTCSQKVRVREIIAATGRVPPKPSQSFAKVLKPSEVCGYIRWFQPELDDALGSRIVEFLRCRVGL